MQPKAALALSLLSFSRNSKRIGSRVTNYAAARFCGFSRDPKEYDYDDDVTPNEANDLDITLRSLARGCDPSPSPGSNAAAGGRTNPQPGPSAVEGGLA